MLDEKKFLQGLNYLKSNYINWNFDLKNMSTIGIWYSKFNHLDNETYKALLEEFTNKSPYAPNSPADILKYIETYYSVEEAWQRILNVISRSYSNQMFQNLMAKEETSLYKFVIGWNIENVSKDTNGNKCYDYCFGRHFKRQYQAYLDSIKVKKIDCIETSNNIPLLEERIDDDE